LSKRRLADVRITEDYEVPESVAVVMDPALDGFAGMLVELVFDGERCVLSETSQGSGSALLRFRFGDPAYAPLRAEVWGDA